MRIPKLHIHSIQWRARHRALHQHMIRVEAGALCYDVLEPIQGLARISTHDLLITEPKEKEPHFLFS
jgi:hypothetical protein